MRLGEEIRFSLLIGYKQNFKMFAQVKQLTLFSSQKLPLGARAQQVV